MAGHMVKSATMLSLLPQRAAENATENIHKNVPGIIEDFRGDLL